MFTVDYPKFENCNINETFTRPVMIAEMESGEDKNQSAFVKFKLLDGFSMQDARQFGISIDEVRSKSFDVGSIVDVTITASDYKGNKTFKITDMRRCIDPNLTPDDFVRHPPLPIDKMFDNIMTTVQGLLPGATFDSDGVQYCSVADLTLSILSDYKDQFTFSSAAESMHHDYIGGLIYHSYRMMKMANAVCDVYDLLDRELLVCGAVLHDIGKIWSYDTSKIGVAKLSPLGVLMDHLYMGSVIVGKYAAEMNCNPERSLLLSHMILSHHGNREWGAVVIPSIPEAMMLSSIDNMDARMYMFEDVYSRIGPGEIEKHFGLGGRVYKPDYGLDALDSKVVQEDNRTDEEKYPFLY